MGKTVEDLYDFLTDSKTMEMGHDEVMAEYGISPDEVVNFAEENNVEYSEAIDTLGARYASMKEGSIGDFVVGVEEELMRGELRSATQEYITDFFNSSVNSEIAIYYVRWLPMDAVQDRREFKYHVGAGYKDGRAEGERCLDILSDEIYDVARLDQDEIDAFEEGLTDLINSKAEDLGIYGKASFRDGTLYYRHYEPVRAAGRTIKRKFNRFGNHIKQDVQNVKDYFTSKGHPDALEDEEIED